MSGPQEPSTLLDAREADPGCPGCSRAALPRLTAASVNRLVEAYVAQHPEARLASDAKQRRRLSVCERCPDLQYGTTCRHCGCLIAVRTKLADKRCPAPTPRWAELADQR